MGESLVKNNRDTTEFGDGSMCVASSSKASNLCVPLEEILSAAGRSQAFTFTKIYRKEVIKTCMPETVLYVKWW